MNFFSKKCLVCVRGPPLPTEGILLGMPSSPSPSLDTHTFLLTVSTKGDISPECIKTLVKHFRSVTVHAYVVTEHGESGKLHLHGVLVYKEPRNPKKLHENLWDRQVKPHHPDSIGRYAVKFQVCPGHDWYDTYLQKECDATVVLDTYDREAVTPYFPTAAVQQVLVELHQAKGKKSCNEWWDKHSSAWEGSAFENTPEGAACYFKQCFLDGSVNRIKRQRDLVDAARGLWEHRNRIVTLSEREIWMLKQLEDGPSFECHGVSGGAPGDSKRLWKDKDFRDPPSI